MDSDLSLISSLNDGDKGRHIFLTITPRTVVCNWPIVSGLEKRTPLIWHKEISNPWPSVLSVDPLFSILSRIANDPLSNINDLKTKLPPCCISKDKLVWSHYFSKLDGIIGFEKVPSPSLFYVSGYYPSGWWFLIIVNQISSFLGNGSYFKKTFSISCPNRLVTDYVH